MARGIVGDSIHDYSFLSAYLTLQRQRLQGCWMTSRGTFGPNLFLSMDNGQLGVLFDSSGATAAQAVTVEHESDWP
jgi:hypothetical protein